MDLASVQYVRQCFIDGEIIQVFPLMGPSWSSSWLCAFSHWNEMPVLGQLEFPYDVYEDFVG